MARQYSVVADFVVRTQNFVQGINTARQSTENFVNNFNDSMQSSQRSIDNVNDNLAELRNRLNIDGDVNDLANDLSQLGTDNNLDELNRDLDRVEDNLEDVGNEAETQTGKVGGAFSGLKSTLGGMVGIIAGIFAVDKIIDFGKTIIETSAEIQALSSQYDQVMGEMKESTDKYLDEMSEKWNKHPNELKGAYMQYVAILKSKGVEEEEAHNLAKQYLDRTVDANAFANESMADTVARFMGGIKGEYDSLDTAMVNLSATMLNDMSMKEYGKKFDELTTAQQETLKAQEMLRQHTSAGVFGQGEREADSYANNLAMVKNTWDELLEKYGSPLLDVANDALKGMVDILENVEDGISRAKDALSPFKEMLKGIMAAFQGKEDKASSILEKLGLSSSEVQQILNAINLIKQYINFLWDYWTTVFEGIKNVVITLFEFFSPYIMPILEAVVSFISEKLSQITKFWEENGEMITQACQNAFDLILQIIEFIMPAVLFVVEMVWESIKGVINGALDVIMGLIKVFAGLFTANWDKLWEGIKQALGGAVEFIWNLMNLMFVGKILSILKSFGTGALNFIKNSWSGIQNSTVSIFNKVSGFISGIIGKIKNFISTGFNNAKDKAVDAVKGLFNGVKTWFDNVLSKAKEIVSDVKSAFQNLSLYQMGRNIIQGLINGIGSLASSVWSKAKSIASGIADSIKNFFGIRSPSRLMMEYGGFIGEGLAKGMTQTEKLVSDAAEGLANFSLPIQFADFNSSNVLDTLSDFDVTAGLNINGNNDTNPSMAGDTHLNLTMNVENLNGTKQEADFLMKEVVKGLDKMGAFGTKRI